MDRNRTNGTSFPNDESQEAHPPDETNGVRQDTDTQPSDDSARLFVGTSRHIQEHVTDKLLPDLSAVIALLREKLLLQFSEVGDVCERVKAPTIRLLGLLLFAFVLFQCAMVLAYAALISFILSRFAGDSGALILLGGALFAVFASATLWLSISRSAATTAQTIRQAARRCTEIFLWPTPPKSTPDVPRH